jgi:quercetin dioxygenase-like cupin family protein
MAIPHAKSGEVVEIRPLGPALATTQTSTLVKTPTLEVIRLILQAGKESCHQHAMAGEVLIQCLEGLITVQVDGDSRTLEAGQMLYLAGGESHAIRGVNDASALLTILLR